MSDLRSELIKLGYEHPKLRPHLREILAKWNPLNSLNTPPPPADMGVRAEKPLPADWLASIGEEMGFTLLETDDFAAFFDVGSPVVRFLTLKLRDHHVKSFSELEIAYVTSDDQKVEVGIFDLEGDLHWLERSGMWSVIGTTKITQKDANKRLNRTKKETQRRIRNILRDLPSNDLEGLNLALAINDHLDLGLDPKKIKKLLDVMAMYS